jgi:hypothetical protein
MLSVELVGKCPRILFRISLSINKEYLTTLRYYPEICDWVVRSQEAYIMITLGA